MTLTAGTIVTAQGDTDEQIVGIVITSPAPLPKDMSLVVWLSDERGAFSCWESDTDVTPANLNRQNDAGSDPAIDRESLALLIGDNITMLSEAF